MPDTVRVAAVQMTCRLGDKAANMAEAEALLADLAGRADIVCLPELFNTGYHLDILGRDLFDLAELVPADLDQGAGPTVTALGELAARLDLAIVAGLAERDAFAAGLL